MTNDEPRNPIKEAMDGWDQLHAEHNALRDAHETLVGEHNNLAARYDVLTKEHQRALRERDLFETYAIGLRTRLVAIKENILAAEQETMQWVKTEIESQRNGGGESHSTQEDDPDLPNEDQLGKELAAGVAHAAKKNTT